MRLSSIKIKKHNNDLYLDLNELLKNTNIFPEEVHECKWVFIKDGMAGLTLFDKNGKELVISSKKMTSLEKAKLKIEKFGLDSHIKEKVNLYKKGLNKMSKFDLIKDYFGLRDQYISEKFINP